MTAGGDGGEVGGQSEVEELVGPSVADMDPGEEDEPMAGPMPPKPKKRKVNHPC